MHVYKILIIHAWAVLYYVILMLYSPMARNIIEWLVYSMPLTVMEQLISSPSATSNSVILTIWFVFIFGMHPEEQLQLNSLSDGGVRVTIHLNATWDTDPTRYSKMLSFTCTPAWYGITLTVYPKIVQDDFTTCAYTVNIVSCTSCFQWPFMYKHTTCKILC